MPPSYSLKLNTYKLKLDSLLYRISSLTNKYDVGSDMSNAMKQSPPVLNAEAPDVFVMAMWPTIKPAPIHPYSRKRIKAHQLKHLFLLGLHTLESQVLNKSAEALSTFAGRPDSKLAKP